MLNNDRVAIVGLGTMGCGIAEAALLHGLRVHVIDSDPAATLAGAARLRSRIAGHAEAGLLGTEALDTLDGVEIADDFSELCHVVDVIVEAVPEEWDVKLSVLAALAEHSADAVIATNTSALPIDELAVAVAAPERFIGVHFFNPAEWIPGVEIIPGQKTCSATTELTVAVTELLGKRPVVVRSSPGFLANRLQLALFAECMRCVQEGLATPEQIDLVVRSTFGFRLPAFGPFAVADMAGLDVYASILQTLTASYGDRFAVAGLSELVEAGRLGVKSGAGFWDYTPDRVAALLRQRDTAYARLLPLSGKADASAAASAPKHCDFATASCERGRSPD